MLECSDTNKKKIGVVFDTHGWVFNRIAKQIQRYLSCYYDVHLLDSASSGFTGLGLDVVILLWWGSYYGSVHVSNCGTKLITCLYDHYIWSSPQGFHRYKAVADKSDLLLVSNHFLLQEVKGKGYDKVYLFEDGVDVEHFPFIGADEHNGKIRCIWVGGTFHPGSVKGAELLEEAADRCKEIVDFKRVSFVSFDEMPSVYRDCDVVMIGSSSEGTPNPFLEALACGKSYIATPVGVIPDIHNRVGGGVIVEERTVRGFCRGIMQMVEQRNKLDRWGRLNRAEIEQNWTWKRKIYDLKQCIDELLKV